MSTKNTKLIVGSKTICNSILEDDLLPFTSKGPVTSRKWPRFFSKDSLPFIPENLPLVDEEDSPSRVHTVYYYDLRKSEAKTYPKFRVKCTGESCAMSGRFGCSDGVDETDGDNGSKGKAVFNQDDPGESIPLGS